MSLYSFVGRKDLESGQPLYSGVQLLALEALQRKVETKLSDLV